MTVAVGVGMETVAGVTMGRMLARGVDLLPEAGLGLLLGDVVLGVGLMLAVGGSDVLELTAERRRSESGIHLPYYRNTTIMLPSY